MKNSTLKRDFKSFFKELLFLCLLLALGSNKAFSQCNYVSILDGKEKKMDIPCDFPVKYNTNNAQKDQANFNIELQNFLTTYPIFKSVVLVPSENSKNNYIEIEFTNFDDFSIEKKKVIQSAPSFYKIVKR